MRRFERFDSKALFFLLFFWLLWFLTFTSRTILAPIAPILEDEFSVSHTSAGGLFAYISIGNGFALFLMGILSGRIGHKLSIVLSLSSSGFLLFLLSRNTIFQLFYILLFFLGFTAGTYLPSSMSILTTIYSQRMWGRVIPIYDSAASTSILLAPYIAYWLSKLTDWRGILLILSIAFFMASFLFHLATRDLQEIKVRRGETPKILTDVVSDRALWALTLILIFAAGSNMGLYYVLPLYLSKELSIDLSTVHKALGFSRLGSIFFAFSIGFALDIIDGKRLLFLISVTTGILTFSIPYFEGKGLVYVLLVQATIVSGTFPLSFVLMNQLVGQKERAFALGFMVSIASIFGIGIIPYILGFFGDYLSFAMGIKLLGLTVLGVSFLALRFNSLQGRT